MSELSTGRGLKRALRFMAFSALCFMPAVSHAGSPVLIEFYGNSYKCTANKTVEREIEELLTLYPNAVLINCRLQNSPRIPEKEAFGRSFCNEGRLGYFQTMGLFSMATPMVIINGRYDANNTQIETAIKAALSMDRIEPIEVGRTEGGIDIRIPEHAGAHGELYLYTYASFEKSDDALAKGQHANRPKAALRYGDHAVFAGDKPFRPVVRREKIMDWNGAQLEMTYPIKEEPFPDYSGASLGHIVVLRESGLFSPVTALAELPAPAIMHSGPGEAPPLPVTEPVLPFKAVPEIPQAPPS